MSKPETPLFTDYNQLRIFIEAVRTLRKYQKLYARYPTAKNEQHVTDFAAQVDGYLARLHEAMILFF